MCATLTLNKVVDVIVCLDMFCHPITDIVVELAVHYKTTNNQTNKHTPKHRGDRASCNKDNIFQDCGRVP